MSGFTLLQTVLWPLISLIAGTLLGLFYFGGLWFTVKRTTGLGRNSSLLVLASFLFRAAVVLAVMSFVVGGGLFPVLAALVGMTGARVFLCTFLDIERGLT